MRAALGASALVWALLVGICQAATPSAARVGDLRSAIASVRQSAAAALGRLGDRSAVPALAGALSDTAPGVRREAAKALGSIKDARAVPVLVAALRDDDRNVRFYAAYALGEIKDPKAAPPLLEALGDPAWSVRDQAAWALRELRDPAIATPLAAALKRKDADLPHILWVLQELGAEHAIAPLAELRTDGDERARRFAVQALADLGGEGVVEPLIAALEDTSPAVRRRAVKALLEIRDKRARQPLQALAAREDDPSLRELVAKVALELSRHQDLAAHWSFDDGNTKVAKDVSGRGSNGQIVGCTPAEGRIGKALAFGKGKYVELGKPSALNIGQQPFTVTAWAKTSAKSGVVVARGGAFCGYSLYIKDGLPKFGIHRVQDGPACIAVGKEAIGDGWMHLAGVVKETSIELYVNGELAATAKTLGYIPGNCGQGMEIGFDVANSPCEITDALEGVIDEVKCFDAALSAAEIAKQANPEPSEPKK